MSRLIKILPLLIVLLFVLACATVTQPFNDVKNLAGTAESLATAMPVETLKSFATQLPLETLQSFVTQIPEETLQAIPSKMPDFESMFNPQGTPVSEWNGVPVMPQATAGQEFPDAKTYSFKVNATVKEAQDFYKAELEKQGWTSFFNMPGDTNGSVQIFQKDDKTLTITIADTNDSVVVILTLA